MTLIFIF